MSATATKTDRIATVGRRKRAVARIRMMVGNGKLTVNEKHLSDAESAVMREPLILTGLNSAVDITVKVIGGGVTGQAGAVRHGIARALLVHDPATRTALKKAGLLTRDPREKERKKPGLKRARRAPQWAKR